MDDPDLLFLSISLHTFDNKYHLNIIFQVHTRKTKIKYVPLKKFD